MTNIGFLCSCSFVCLLSTQGPGQTFSLHVLSNVWLVRCLWAWLFMRKRVWKDMVSLCFMYSAFRSWLLCVQIAWIIWGAAGIYHHLQDFSRHIKNSEMAKGLERAQSLWRSLSAEKCDALSVTALWINSLNGSGDPDNKKPMLWHVQKWEGFPRISGVCASWMVCAKTNFAQLHDCKPTVWLQIEYEEP